MIAGNMLSYFGALYFRMYFQKQAGLDSSRFLGISRMFPDVKPRWGVLLAHNIHAQCLTAHRTSVRLPNRSRAQNCEKNTICKERGQRTLTRESRNIKLLELCDIHDELPERSVGY